MAKKEIAYFGAGCFWHPQYVFDKTPGVIETSVGYMGGAVKDPTYEMVCSDKSGHIEVTKVVFDPDKIKYEELLKIFWEMHDPTQFNRQGPDVGTQYKSVVFYDNDKQKEIALQSKKEIQKSIKGKRVFTEIIKAPAFYPAEAYHQKYVQRTGRNIC